MRSSKVLLRLLFMGLLATYAQAVIGNTGKQLQIAANALKNTHSQRDFDSLQTNNNTTAQAEPSEPQVENPCATSLNNLAQLTQTQLINELTDSCRYDTQEPPFMQSAEPNSNGTTTNQPVQVHARLYVYVLQNPDSNDLQFTLQGLLQLRYTDPRLAYGKYAPNRRQPIMGEAALRNLIWVPHIFIANEERSAVLGTEEKDILTTIQPDGQVIISSRIQATLYCWMNFQKFPFDEQRCSAVLESWMYNTSMLQLNWELEKPVFFDPALKLTEFALSELTINETIVIANELNMRHGNLVGNYSSISFSVLLTREVGYYIMEYFLPSIMIVAISWVTFWLQADQTPARTTLGATTLLSFITLSLSQENNVSKVSYITLSEVWFLVCTSFIFLSLVEFAFVNAIFRRSNNLELKKRTTKYIVRSTFTKRGGKYQSKMQQQQQCGGSGNSNNSNCHSNNDINKCNDNNNNNSNNNNNNENNTIITIEAPIILNDMDAINNLNSITPSTTSSTFSIEDNAAITPNSANSVECISFSLKEAVETKQQNSMESLWKYKPQLKRTKSTAKQQKQKEKEKQQQQQEPRTWSTMTPREVSLWIDHKMRIVFPLAFIIFNALFWTLVYCL